MPSVSVAGLLLRLVVSLGVVIALMAVLARLARGRGLKLGGRAPGAPYQLQVLSRQPVGKNASVLLVRAGDKGLLLGVTEHSVSLIQETEIPPVEEAAPEAARVRVPTRAGVPAGARAGAAALQRARELTVRRV